MIVEMLRADVIVIGAGPAGLMAAGSAAAAGAQVLLLEKMGQPGRKLRLTGKGRCNLTNIAPLEEFIPHFGASGRFLYSAFSKFFSGDLIEFLEGLGVQTVVERGGRVFPVSNDAQEIVAALTAWAQEAGVRVKTQARVERILVEDARLIGVQVIPMTAKKETRRAQQPTAPYPCYCRCAVLATGGASYPGTGSSGDGYTMAQALGHIIIPIRPALVPLETEGDLAPRLQGLSLRNVRVSILLHGRSEKTAFGEMLFTHFGVSGPVILTLSRAVVDALQAGEQVELSIDLKPALEEDVLDARLRRDLEAHGKRQFRTILKGLLPRKLIPVCIEQTGIPEGKPAHQINAEQRSGLRHWLKDFRLTVSGHRSFREAIVTAGGVDLREVDPRTMGSRIVEGLYFAGEVLDLDADTGGYNLQAAFSTGWLAGISAAEAARRQGEREPG